MPCVTANEMNSGSDTASAFAARYEYDVLSDRPKMNSAEATNPPPKTTFIGKACK